MQLDSCHHSGASSLKGKSTSVFREDLLKAYDKGILPINFFYLHKTLQERNLQLVIFLEEL